MVRKLLTGVAIVVAVALLGAVWIAAGIEERLNRVEPRPLPQVSDQARRVHESSFVVDLHADSLLFGRNLLERSDVGHIDLPRLREGGVGLQFFTATTKTPMGFNIDRTDGDAMDLITVMGLLQVSPMGWRSPYGRALLQAERLQGLAEGSGGELVLVRDRADLGRLLQRHAQNRRVVGGLLGIEGAHALDGKLENLDGLDAAGYRMIGLAHFFDNAFSGSAHGVEKGGLTELGRALVRRMEERGILVDLAHVSPAAIRDVLSIATKPVVVSHTGVKGTCDNARNLSDEQVRAIAATGGVIGIGYWDTAVCGTEPRHIVAAMRHVVALAGEDHVGLGSDFDGATTTAFDTSALPALTQEMLSQGFSEKAIRKILGDNAVRVLLETLPAAAEGPARPDADSS